MNDNIKFYQGLVDTHSKAMAAAYEIEDMKKANFHASEVANYEKMVKDLESELGTTD